MRTWRSTPGPFRAPQPRPTAKSGPKGPFPGWNAVARRLPAFGITEPGEIAAISAEIAALRALRTLKARFVRTHSARTARKVRKSVIVGQYNPTRPKTVRDCSVCGLGRFPHTLPEQWRTHNRIINNAKAGRGRQRQMPPGSAERERFFALRNAKSFQRRMRRHLDIFAEEAPHVLRTLGEAGARELIWRKLRGRHNSLDSFRIWVRVHHGAQPPSRASLEGVRLAQLRWQRTAQG